MKHHYDFYWYDDDGSDRSYGFSLDDLAQPHEVYKEFLVFLNSVYGWDTEKWVAFLYESSVD